MTPTIDHTDPTPHACGCRPHRLCLLHYGQLQRLRHARNMREWAALFGSVPRKTERKEPVLRLVK